MPLRCHSGMFFVRLLVPVGINPYFCAMTMHPDRLRDEFGELYKSNYTRLFYCALDIVNDEEWAKDIVGEVFSRMWNDYPKLHSLNMESYLWTSVRNRSIDHVRRRNAITGRSHILMEVENEWHAAHSDEYEEEIQYMHKTIDEMPERQRHIFRRCFIDGKRYCDVAREMDLKESSIHKNMVKSFAFIKEKFKKRKT